MRKMSSAVSDVTLLCLVMRLTKPSLMTSQLVLSCCQQDLPQDAFSTLTEMDASLQSQMPHFSLTSLLTLPQNFG